MSLAQYKVLSPLAAISLFLPAGSAHYDQHPNSSFLPKNLSHNLLTLNNLLQQFQINAVDYIEEQEIP